MILIITGRPFAFRDRRAGTRSVTVPRILLPKPPPQYSLMMTRSSSSSPRAAAWARLVCETLWVEQWRKSFPFCQYAMALRDSSGWCVWDWWTMGSSRTSADAAKAASRSP